VLSSLKFLSVKVRPLASPPGEFDPVFPGWNINYLALNSPVIIFKSDYHSAGAMVGHKHAGVKG